jgi:hypothetical protein
LAPSTALEGPSDIADVLPALLPDRIVEIAEQLTGGPAALYVVDLQGSSLVRLSGSAAFPATIGISGALGPEAGAQTLDELARELDVVLAGGVLAPLWLRDRATAAVLAARDPAGKLDSFARAVAPRFELASGYTDVIDRARRRRRTSAAAEVQQDLLAPRITPIAGGEIAGTLLPAYDVGGDWFDHAENPEGAWLTVADAMGKGTRATAVSALALAALRGARRAGDSLEECCLAVHEAVEELGVAEPTFLTAVVSTWHSPSRTLAWVCCGHPPPLLVAADGSSEELDGPIALPLGLPDTHARTFERGERYLYSGDRVILYSDGITERRTATARFGVDGLLAAVRSAKDTSSVATAAAIETAVLGASDERMSDDATQLILRIA